MYPFGMSGGGGAGGTPNVSTVTGILPVANGGTGSASGPTPTFSGARVYFTVNQAIPSSADSATTFLTFNGENFDTDGYHDNVTNNSRLTIPATGTYMVFLRPLLLEAGGGAGVGERCAACRLNGTTTIYNDSRKGVSSNNLQYSCSFIRRFTAGDYIEMAMGQSSGTSMNASAGTETGVHFAIYRLGLA